MTHYSDALEWMDLADIALSKEMFRKSVYHSCMAIELLLKHVAVRHVTDADNRYAHNHRGLWNLVTAYYGDMLPLSIAKLSMKYLNISRYTSREGHAQFTEDFAKGFILHSNEVKSYVDSHCGGDTEEIPEGIYTGSYDSLRISINQDS